MRDDLDFVTLTTNVGGLKLVFLALVQCAEHKQATGVSDDQAHDMMMAADEINELINSPFENSDLEAQFAENAANAPKGSLN